MACNFYTQFYIYPFNLLAIHLRLSFKIQTISKLLYKTQFCVPFSDELKVAKFLFPSLLQFVFYGWIETDAQIFSTKLCGIPYTLSPSSNMRPGWFVLLCTLLWLLWCNALGNVARGALGTVQGLTFYCSKDN